jgi:NAD(P)-dependent dehydrogenase (short-subunit alcohol dehydrogenase family)
MERTVLITGASGNLGKAAVERFLRDGYQIIATVSPGKLLGYDVNGNVSVVEVDLTNQWIVDQFVENSIKKHSTINAALLLVGAFASGTINNTNEDALDKMISVNFKTAYFAARKIFSHMITQPNGGRIVLVGSKPAINPSAGKNSLAYAISKNMLFQLAEILNAESVNKNVSTHVIVPSIIDTPANRSAMPQANPSDLVKPEEVAEAMAYLCSDKGMCLRETVLKIYGNS